MTAGPTDQTDGKWTNEQIDKATDKRTDGQPNGPTDKWNDGPMHHGSKVSKNDALGEKVTHSRAPLAPQCSVPLRYVPLHYAPLYSKAPLRAAPLRGSFMNEKVAYIARLAAS